MRNAVINGVRTLLAPIKQRVLLMISRAVVKVVMDDKQMQLLQISVLKDEVLEGVEHFQPYGFTSNPKPGAEAVLACVGGDRNHPLVIVVDDRRYRKKNLGSGESALYNSNGDYIWLKNDGTVEVKCTQTHVKGNLVVDGTTLLTGLVTTPAGIISAGGMVTTGTPDGTITDGEGSMQEMRDVYNTHTHPQSGGGTTNAPNQHMT